MANFRGIGDDAMKVMREQEQERLEQQRINEQVRSNMAQEALRNKQLNIQQKEAAKDRAFRKDMAGAEMDFKRQSQLSDLDYRRSSDDQRFGLEQQRIDLQTEEAERRASALEQQQKQADELFNMRKAEWDAQQAQQAEEMRIAQTELSVGVRELMFNGVVSPKTLANINAANGVAKGEPFEITKMYNVFNPEDPRDVIGAVMEVRLEDGSMTLEPIPNAALIGALGVLSPATRAGVFSSYLKQYDGLNNRMTLDIKAAQKAEEAAQREAERIQRQGAARAQSGSTRGGGARGGGGGDDMGAQLKRAQEIRAWMSEIQKRIDDGTATDSDLSLMENLKNTEYHLSQVASRTAQGMTQEDPEAEVMRQVEQKSGLISQYNTAAEQLEELRTEALEIKEVAEKDMKSDIGLSYSEKIGKIKALSATMNDIVAKMNKDRMPAPSTFTDLTREELNSPSVAGAHDRESPFPKTAVKNAIGGISHIQAQRGSDESGVQIIIDDVKNNKQVAIPVVDIKEPDPSNKDAHRRWENYMKLRMLIGDKEIDYVVAETQRAIMEADAVIAKRAAEGYLEKVGRKQAASRARKEEEKSGTMRKVSARGGL